MMKKSEREKRDASGIDKYSVGKVIELIAHIRGVGEVTVRKIEKECREAGYID